MRAKEYLNQLRHLNGFIDCKLVELDQLRDLSTRVQGMNYDNERVQTSAKNTSENLIIRIIDTEESINGLIDRYVDLKYVIIEQLDAMKEDNPLYYRILFAAYVEQKALNRIADDMNYSHQYIREVHGRALQEFEKRFLKDDKDSTQ